MNLVNMYYNKCLLEACDVSMVQKQSGAMLWIE